MNVPQHGFPRTFGAKSGDVVSSRTFWVLGLAIVALGALLRLPSLARESLWVDEFITLRLAHTPLVRLPLAAAQSDSQPPLFYLLVKAALFLGSGEAVLRLTSALAGLATIPVLGWIAGQLSGRRSALVVMGILALSPFHVWYSQEARAYALVILLLTLSVGFLLRARGTGRSVRLAWIGFVVTTALALYTHLMALPFLLVQLAVAVALGGRSGASSPDGRWVDWRKVLLAQAGALLVFSPEAVVLFRHGWLDYLLPPTSIFLEGPTRTFAPSAAGLGSLAVAVGYGLFTLLAGFSLGPSVRELHEAAGRTVSSFLTPGVVAFCLLLAPLAWLAFRSFLRREPLGRVGLAWTAVSVAAIAVGVFFAEAPFRPRYVAIALPGILLWLTGGVSTLGSGAKRAAASAAVAAALLIPLTQRWNPRYVKEDIRSAAAYVRNAGASEANIVVAGRSVADGVRYYLDAGAAVTPWEVRPYPTSGMVGTLEDAREQLRAVAPDTVSAWLLLARPWEYDPKELVLVAAEDAHAVEPSGAWPGVRLFLLTPKEAHP